MGELLGFVAGEGAAEESGLAVAEPLFEDLVAAEGGGPDGLGDVFPAGGGVEVDVEEASPRVPEVVLPGPGFSGASSAGLFLRWVSCWTTRERAWQR